MSTNALANIAAQSPKLEREVFYHPNYIVRVAGEPIDLLYFAENGSTAKLIEEKDTVVVLAQEQSRQACTLLEKLIPDEDDKVRSRDLINSKRALFNLKPLKAASLTRMEEFLSEDVYVTIKTAHDFIESLSKFDQAITRAYQVEVEAGADHLDIVWKQENIRQGVSYSNPKLFRDFEGEYGDAKAGRLNAKKKRKLDDTMFQYLARCSTKTSPLSALTPVYVGRWLTNDNTSVKLVFDSAKKNCVDFKSGLLRQIIDKLFEDFSTWKDHVAISLNQSLNFSSGKIQFTQMSKGNTAGGKTWGTGESRVELNPNGLLQCILHVLNQRPPMLAIDIVSAVCKLAPKLQAEMVLEYLGKLFSVGLLLPAIETEEQSDTLQWVLHTLEKFGDKYDQGIEKIQAIRHLIDEFSVADHSRRADITETLEQLANEFAYAIGSEVDKNLERPAFFENTYLTRSHEDLSENSVKAITHDLEAILQLAPILDMNQKVQAQFSDYFLHKFGPDAICEDPMQLIREFDEIYGVAQFGHTQDAKKLAPKSDVYKQYSKIADSWDAFLTPYLQCSEDVDITADKIRELTERLPQVIKNRSLSHSYVGQVFESEDQVKFVINQVFGGNSGLLSRFLEILDQDGLEQIKEYLKKCARHHDYAEMPGVFGFNANKHPRMADREIVIPPFAPNWSETEKIPFKSLKMRYDKLTHKVCFVDVDGRFLDVFYQGFLIPSLMPQIQRFIAINNAHGLNFFTIGTLFNCDLIEKNKVTIVPRVSVGSVVLSRRMHLVPRAFVPSPDVSAFDFFMAIQRWRKEHNLPNEAFIRAFPIGDGKVPGVDSEVDWSQISFKDAKPFYVKFDDPRFVRLLSRILKRSPFDLTITEVLPKIDDQHVTINNRRHVSELHIELSKRVAE